MTRLPLLQIPAFLTLLAIPSAAASANLSLTHLGAGSQVNAISSDGGTVCGDINIAAFVWTAADGVTILNPPAGASQWRATGVNGDGTVIVGSSTSGTPLATRWTNEVPQSLGSLGSSMFSQSSANAVTPDGSLIVGFTTTPTLFQEAFRLENGTMTGIGTLPTGGGTPFSIANGVSADGGVIVGRSSSNNGSEAFLKRNGQAMVGLGDIPSGAFSSSALAASNNGDVVVGWGSIDLGTTSGPLAFRWTSATGMQPLPLPPSGFGGEARAITPDGQLIGGKVHVGTNAIAALWDDDAGLVIVEDELEARGIDLSNWLLFSVDAISADGDTIAGRGAFNGSPNSWVLTGALQLLEEVVPLPAVEITRAGTSVTLDFATLPGYLYQAEVSPDLGEGSWDELGAEHSTAGAGAPGSHQVTDGDATGGKAFYRVRVEPAP